MEPQAIRNAEIDTGEAELFSRIAARVEEKTGLTVTDPSRILSEDWDRMRYKDEADFRKGLLEYVVSSHPAKWKEYQLWWKVGGEWYEDFPEGVFCGVNVPSKEARDSVRERIAMVEESLSAQAQLVEYRLLECARQYVNSLQGLESDKYESRSKDWLNKMQNSRFVCDMNYAWMGKRYSVRFASANYEDLELMYEDLERLKEERLSIARELSGP